MNFYFIFCKLQAYYTSMSDFRYWLLLCICLLQLWHFLQILKMLRLSLPLEHSLRCARPGIPWLPMKSGKLFVEKSRNSLKFWKTWVDTYFSVSPLLYSLWFIRFVMTPFFMNIWRLLCQSAEKSSKNLLLIGVIYFEPEECSNWMIF